MHTQHNTRFSPFQASPRCLVSQFSVFHFSARCIFAHFCRFHNQKEHSIQLCSVSRSRSHILPVTSPALLAIHAPLLSSPRLLYKFIQYAYYSPAFLNKSHAKSLIQPKREPAPARPREAPPTQAACMRGVRGPARRMETSPAPGSLWFLSPAGKELVRPQKCFCQGWKVSFLRDNAFHFILRRQRFHK